MGRERLRRLRHDALHQMLDAIIATGDDWQTRVNDALRGKFLKNRAARAMPVTKKPGANAKSLLR